MTQIQMHHRTTTLEKTFSVAPNVVFDAWADLEKRGQWNSPSDEVTIRYTEDNFTPGGRDVSLCLVGDHIVAEVEGLYHDIVTNQRIVYTEIIKSEDTIQGVSQVSVSFTETAGGTEMIVTLQTVALAGPDVLEEVAMGWTAAMEMMEKMLAE